MKIAGHQSQALLQSMLASWTEDHLVTYLTTTGFQYGLQGCKASHPEDGPDWSSWPGWQAATCGESGLPLTSGSSTGSSKGLWTHFQFPWGGEGMGRLRVIQITWRHGIQFQSQNPELDLETELKPEPEYSPNWGEDKGQGRDILWQSSRKREWDQ